MRRLHEHRLTSIHDRGLGGYQEVELVNKIRMIILI